MEFQKGRGSLPPIIERVGIRDPMMGKVSVYIDFLDLQKCRYPHGQNGWS